MLTLQINIFFIVKAHITDAVNIPMILAVNVTNPFSMKMNLIFQIDKL